MRKDKDPLAEYECLQKTFAGDVMSDANLKLLTACVHASLDSLKKFDMIELVSQVQDKSYFAFAEGTKFSRAVNKTLFQPSKDEWNIFADALKRDALTEMTPQKVTSVIYTAAISFCCFVDLKKERDQKTPGTFFEYLIGHLFARKLGVNPLNKLPVLNLGISTTLPTDFIFDLGLEKPKFHLPIKTSTRERVIQVWAHQRVLDGVYGTGRFLGTPVILAETKTDQRKRVVTEICLPDQWRIYQMHIAQLKRIYYLDVPSSYSKLNAVFPRLHVAPFGQFFFEFDSLLA